MEDNNSESATWTLRIPPILVLLLILLLILTIVIAVKSCSSVKRTSWELMEPPSGNQLKIGVLVGGCDGFDNISVTENNTAVVVEAYLRHNIRSACPSILNREPKTVQLHAPLGDRALHGCNPPSSVYEMTGQSDRDCTVSVQ